MGRYGADPGRYEMPGMERVGLYGTTSTKKMPIHKSDRGLLPLDKDQMKSK